MKRVLSLFLACILLATMLPLGALAAGNANGDTVYRIIGDNRYATSKNIAEMLKETTGVEKFSSLIIASGNNFPDALAGSYLAAVTGAPIILTNNNRVLDKNWCNANLMDGATVYILGGTAAVPEESIEPLMQGSYSVLRLAGANRYETNLMILGNTISPSSERDLLVCTGTNFADSLSASATGKPILLVKNSLTAEQRSFLYNAEFDNFYVIGGTCAVNATIESELAAYGYVTRISGSNRYETSVKIAEYFFPDADSAVLAYAKNFPDGLCGGPLAFAMNAPLILTASGSEVKAAAYAAQADIHTGIVLGGEGLISDDTTQTVFRADSITRYGSSADPDHVHEWNRATCTVPKNCRACGRIEGEAPGHQWLPATCTDPRRCSVCATEDYYSIPLGHNYVQGTCTRCGVNDPDYVPPVLPSLTADRTSLYLDGDSDTVYITLLNADSLTCEISDPGIVDWAWGNWHGDTISVTFYPLSRGETDFTVFVPGYDISLTIHITVASGAMIFVDTNYLYFSDDSLDGVFITVADNTGLIYHIDDTDIVTCEWGDWDGYTIPLWFYPGENGETDVTIYTEDYEHYVTIHVVVDLPQPGLTIEGVGETYYYDGNWIYLHSAEPEITYSRGKMDIDIDVIAEITDQLDPGYDSNWIQISYELIDENGICVDSGLILTKALEVNQKYADSLWFYVDEGNYTLRFMNYE